MPDGQSSYAKHIKQKSNFTFCLIFTVLFFFYRGIRAKWAKQSLNPHEYLKELWDKGNGKAAIC